MKKNINLLVTFISFLFVTFAKAEISFRDTFNNISTVGDVNTEISVAGRQFGSLAPLSYVAGQNTIVGNSAIFPNQLTFTNRNGTGPDYNFMNSKNYTIEFDLIETPTGVGDWLSIAFGKDLTLSGPNSAGSGLGMLFRGEGGCHFFDEENALASGSLPTVPFHVLISVSMENSESTKAAVFINSKPVLLGGVVELGTGNPFIYRKPSGFTDNNISFYNFDTPMIGKTGVIDNLTINSTSSDFFEYDWTDDATSQISSNKNYTHKINLGDDSDIDINGVTFTGSSTSFSGTDWSMINGFGNNNFQKLSVGGTTISGDSANLVSDFIYEGHGQSTAIILSNLVAGQSYIFTLYNRGFGAGLRESFFAAADSGSAMATFNQNVYGTSGKLVKYFYKAPSNGVFSMAISTKDDASWHYYAFSNEENSGAQPPANVSASQGDFTDKVVVNWNAVEDADKYQVWRNDFDSSSSAATLSTELSETTFTDTTATVNLDYYYWVKAKNTNGWSEFGESALGFSTDSTGPVKPTNISPADNAKISDFPISLIASDYSDAVWSMVSVQWQIDDRTSFATPIYDSEELFITNTSILVPTGPLVLTNYWRVRYKNNRNQWSDWSDYTLFFAERDFDSPFYFYETFNNISGSGDVNKDYFITGRQLGSAAPIDYISQGTSEIGGSATNPNKLTLSGEDSSCSPNQNFEKFGNFKIEVDIKPSASGSAIAFGKSSQNLPPNSAGGMAFVFYGDGSGRYEFYDSETLVGTFTNDAVKSSDFHFMATTSGDFDGSSRLVAAFVDGEPLILYTEFSPEAFHSNHFDYVYEKDTGFSKNYITLYNFNGFANFDNFQIQKTTTNLNVFAWSNDADSRIGDGASISNYTHAVNLRTVGNIDINGVTFIGAGTSVVYGLNPVGAVQQRFIENGTAGLTGSNWVVSAADGLFETDSDWTMPGNNLPAEGNKLLEHCLFSSWDGVEIKLNNLTPGSSNVFAMHFFQWWGNGYDIPIVGNDGAVPVLAPIDVLGHQGEGVIFEYKYKASENGTFSFTLSVVQHPIFSFSNYETAIPDPNLFTINSLDFGEVFQGESKTFLLPVFNFGAGIVSGNVDGITAPFSFPEGSNYSAKSESPDFVNITFAPTSEDYFSNTVLLIGNDGSVQIELKGIGVPEPILVIGYLLSIFAIFFARRK